MFKSKAKDCLRCLLFLTEETGLRLELTNLTATGTSISESFLKTYPSRPLLIKAFSQSPWSRTAMTLTNLCDFLFTIISITLFLRYLLLQSSMIFKQFSFEDNMLCK